MLCLQTNKAMKTFLLVTCLFATIQAFSQPNTGKTYAESKREQDNRTYNENYLNSIRNQSNSNAGSGGGVNKQAAQELAEKFKNNAGKRNTSSNNNTYDDEYDNDENYSDFSSSSNGQKIIKYSNGAVYEGNVNSNNRPHGFGKKKYANGNRYAGYFENGKRNGSGKLTFVDGDVYDGEYVYGLRTGKGKYTWANGNYYIGDFADGSRTGKGKYVWTVMTEILLKASVPEKVNTILPTEKCMWVIL